MGLIEAKTGTHRLVYTSLMICLILLGTIVFRIPVPMTQGYVHLGDAMIYLGVMLLGRKQGSAAAALGSALGDILGGYAFWAPWTLAIKFTMAYVTGSIIERASQGEHYHKPSGAAATVITMSSMAAGGLVMCAGYLAAETVMYGSFAPAILGLPWNIGQVIVGMVLSMAIYSAIDVSTKNK